MVVVAVAGAGGMGKAIISAILSTNKHTLHVLSRSANPVLESQGAHVHVVDYESVPSLVAALDGVHTVISTLADHNAEKWIAAQLNLLEAAKTVGAKRFAPSEFAGTASANHFVDLYAPKLPVWDAVKKSGLEYTAFRVGIFMNYLAFNSPHPRVMEEVFDSARPIWWNVDISTATAVIPGTGDEETTFTRTQDMGKFVAAALDLEVWTEETNMGGEVTTYNKIVKEAERITGKKINVTYISKEEIEKQIEETTDQMQRFSVQVKKAFVDGAGFVKPELNEIVPHVKPVGITAFLEKWWGDKE